MNRPNWPWSLVLVASVHLLTTSGNWTITDHGEALFMAQRILEKGTIHLWDPGEPAPTFMAWTLPPAGPLLSRFLPVTSFTLLPLLVLDRSLGLGEAGQFGRFVHFQGHIFILGALAMLGKSLVRLGASQCAAAAAVLLTGLSWPVWSTALHLGPEALLVFLVTAFFAGGARRRALVCAALPWVHALGPEISVALVVGAGIEAVLEGKSVRSVSLEVGGAFLGIVSFIVLWNHLYQGSWLLGGYASYRVETYLQNPLKGLPQYLGALVFGAPILLAIGIWGWRASPGRVGGAAVAATLTIVLILANAPFARTDETRRVVVAAPAWGMVVGQTWDRLRFRPTWAEATLLLGSIPGVFFLMQAGSYYNTPWGLYFLPTSLWLRLLNQGRVWTALLPVSILLLVFATALLKVRALFMDTLISHAPRP